MGKLRFLLMTVLITGALGYLTIARAQDNVPSSTTSGKTIYLPTINLNASAQPDQQPASARDTVVRILYGSQAELEYLLSEYDIFEESCGQSCLVALVSNAEYRRLANEGRLVAVDAQRTSQLAADVSQVRQAVRAAGVDAIESIPGFACYRTVEETYSSLAALAAANPQIATWTDIGDTWEKVTPGGAAGYDMYALKLTNSAIPGPKPKFMLMSAIHAREYTTAELATRFAEELISKYNVDPDVTWLLDYFEVHIIPMVNPDGRKKAETGLLWRKNTDNNDGCNNSSTWGTDLNRNSSFKWNNGGSSSSPCNETYRGPSAGSEPEVQVIQNYATSIFPDQRGPNDNDPAPATTEGVFITLHSYAQLVLYPWGYTATPSPNITELATLGRKFGYYNGYQVCNGPICLYNASGTTDDYTYGELGVASYTIELGTAFFESCSSFTSSTLPLNMPALYYAAKAARRPYQNPAGPDPLNVSVSPATVPQGDLVTLTATLDDTRYNSNGWGNEPVQNIAAGQYTIDAPSWAGGIPVAMSASDGTFNATVEGVTASLDTSALAPGRHTVFVEGQDANGNWGVLSAAFLWVTFNGPTPTPTDTPLPTDTPTPTDTPLPTNTPTITPTPTDTPIPTNTPIAGNTGFLSPSAQAAQTSSAGDNNGFQTNPANALADGGGVAVDTNSGSNSSSSCTATTKDKHHFYNYNVSLPGGVTVTGIEVRLDAFVDSVGSNSPKMCVELSWDGGATWTTAQQSSTLTTSEATYILGGAADTWGHAWTTGELTNANFRLRVTNVASGSRATSRDFSLDWVAIQVDYQ